MTFMTSNALCVWWWFRYGGFSLLLGLGTCFWELSSSEFWLA